MKTTEVYKTAKKFIFKTLPLLKTEKPANHVNYSVTQRGFAQRDLSYTLLKIINYRGENFSEC
jgi:hypothetical protein